MKPKLTQSEAVRSHLGLVAQIDDLEIQDRLNCGEADEVREKLRVSWAGLSSLEQKSVREALSSPKVGKKVAK